ncbi:CoA pyrophosphatase [Vibrio sp. SM6]|uniref:CoA pyrophosphatase n=1 Tax=Vibrio agarilyticus TaxID=2726741 RepID=A0A7X8YG65_9VIBR|nr:CoA pyrophosphatase [Vibrio agarilyticus]NLS12638.1 CoA pyrophosphatase [Vibrio agarilyticus]
MILTAQMLKQHFSLQLPMDYHAEAIARTQHINPTTLRKAAVLIGFVERENGLHVLLTTRAKHLRHHPGQVSFPGGKFESSDQRLNETALRETEEELGIERSSIEIFGQLPPLPTISGFQVTPFLAQFSPRYQLNIDANEVDNAFEVPATWLLSRTNLHTSTFTIRGHQHRIFALNYQHHFIWGVTAQIIDALQRQLISLYSDTRFT